MCNKNCYGVELSLSSERVPANMTVEGMRAWSATVARRAASCFQRPWSRCNENKTHRKLKYLPLLKLKTGRSNCASCVRAPEISTTRAQVRAPPPPGHWHCRPFLDVDQEAKGKFFILSLDDALWNSGEHLRLEKESQIALSLF